MESIDTRLKRLEIVAENMEDRIDDLDIRTSYKFKQIEPVMVHAANRNVIFYLSVAITLVNIVLLILKASGKA
jgi:hypothetical protein